MHRTLKEQNLYPYHVQKVQALEPTDFPHRVIYCELLLQQRCEFTLDGVFISHNTHIWSDENLQARQKCVGRAARCGTPSR